MKTLSIKQPWASLILEGGKDIENRTWKTGYRGKIYIHTPKTIDTLALFQIRNNQHLLDIVYSHELTFESILDRQGWSANCLTDCPYLKIIKIGSWKCENCKHYISKDNKVSSVKCTYPSNKNIITSAIVGTVDIVDCIQDSSSIWAESHMYNWVLENAVKFDKPILGVKGKLKLYDYLIGENS